MYNLLRFIPKNHLSYFFGLFAKLKAPRWFVRKFIFWFANRYQANLEESEYPIEHYDNLLSFFTRELKVGVRTIGDSAIVSPVDGKLVHGGLIENSTLIQAKGKQYSVQKLLGDFERAKKFERGAYLTFYLAPGDYHHIRSPLNGVIGLISHIEGKLWPVNSWSVETIKELFCVNERIITYIESELGSCAVVKVGATNVGSIRSEFSSFIGNSNLSFARGKVSSCELSSRVEVKKGDKIGSFYLGSTVVLVFENRSILDVSKIKMGLVKYGENLQ
jgi:phosphatidylserine decarboxylase